MPKVPIYNHSLDRTNHGRDSRDANETEVNEEAKLPGRYMTLRAGDRFFVYRNNFNIHPESVVGFAVAGIDNVTWSMELDCESIEIEDSGIVSRDYPLAVERDQKYGNIEIYFQMPRGPRGASLAQLRIVARDSSIKRGNEIDTKTLRKLERVIGWRMEEAE